MDEKELQILENTIKYFQNELDNGNDRIIYNENFWNENTIDIINTLNELKQKLKQKNKIIDLMVCYLTTPIHGEKWVKQYFEDKVKEDK